MTGYSEVTPKRVYVRVGDDPPGTHCTRVLMSELPLTRFIESATGITASSETHSSRYPPHAKSRRNPRLALFAFYQEGAQLMKKLYAAWGWQQSTLALA
jgi:hypothetical protein